MTKKYENLTPFKMCVLQNFPFIEEDFDALTNYELLCKVVEYLNKTIDQTNKLTNDVKNLLEWFDHLDVQDEVNKKLDKMATDGTLARIINQDIFEELNARVTANENNIEATRQDLLSVENDITKINNTLTKNANEELTYLRNKYSKLLSLKGYPENMGNWFNDLFIYKNENDEVVDYYINVDALKNAGGSTYYVDKNSTITPTHGTEEAPWKDLKVAFQNTNDRDTIIVKKGIYYRQELPQSGTVAKNNVNIICEPGTIFTTSESLNWVQNGVYPHVYQTTRTNAVNVIDIRNRERDIFTMLTKLNDLQSVELTRNTYYTDGSNVYVNIGEEVTNDKVVVGINLRYSALRFDVATLNKNLKIYMENVTLLNGEYPILSVFGSEDYSAQFVGKNIKSLFCTNTESYNGMSFNNTKSLLINCECSFNGRDGFNYHNDAGLRSDAIEINCVGSNNGLGNTLNDSSNGSTIHDGGHIVRINGVYHDNKGPNVGDIGSGSISVNYNCIAFDSKATDNTRSNDFGALSGGTKMYCYNCFAKGDSLNNLYAEGSSTLYNDKTIYDKKSGNIVDI